MNRLLVEISQFSSTQRKISILSSKIIDSVKAGDSFNYKALKIKIKYECRADNKVVFYYNVGKKSLCECYTRFFSKI